MVTGKAKARSRGAMHGRKGDQMNNTDKGVEVISEIVRLICKRPRELVITREDTPGTVELAIEANPADTRRLVGREGRTLAALRLLLDRMSEKPCGLAEKRITIANPINSNGKDPHPIEPFVVQPNWPRAKVEGLVGDVLELIYGVPVRVLTVQNQPYAVKLYGIPQMDLAGREGFGQVDRALETVFTPIGTNVGMRLYCHARDWRDQTKPKSITPAG